MSLPRKPRTLIHGLLVTVLVLGLGGPVLAQNLLTVRVESLDAALGDITTIAAAAGQPMTKEQILAPVLGQLGVDDLSFLDWKSPAALVVPMAGMMLQQKGILLALPVTDPETALELLGGQFSSQAVEEGLHVFSTDAGPQLYVTSGNGYLALGGSRDLLRGFDLAGALARPDAPDGNLVVDVNIEPIAPMAAAGLMGIKDQLKQQMRMAAAADSDAPPAVADMMGSFAEMYVGLAVAAINNTSRVQVVPEVTPTHVIPHLRLVPRSGGTLAGLLASQTGSLPSLARHVPAGGIIVGAGQMTLTPEAREFLRDVSHQYLSAVQTMVAEFKTSLEAHADATDAAAAEGSHEAALHAMLLGLLSSFPQGLADLQSKAIDCSTGAMAFSLDLDPSAGFSMTQVKGFDAAKEGCADLTDNAMGMVRDWLGQVPGLGAFVSIEASGSHAWNIDVNLGEHLAEAPAEAAAMLNTLLLDEGVFRARVGQAKGFSYGIAGKGAEKRASAIGGPAQGGGVSADAFAPLPSGAGYYYRVDVGRLLAALEQIVPAEEKDEELTRVARALSGPAGQFPFALRLDSGGVNVEAALNLKTVSALATMAREAGGTEDHGHGDAGHEPAAQGE